VAVTERDFALAEVLDELIPLGLGAFVVLGGRASESPVVDEAFVSVEHVLLVDRGASARYFDVVVANDLRRKMDWEPNIDDVRDEDPSEVVWRVVDSGAVRPTQPKAVRQLRRPLPDGATVIRRGARAPNCLAVRGRGAQLARKTSR